MLENNRNISLLLLVCALIGLIIFYGCGGGSSSDPLPVLPQKTYRIIGKVTSTEAITNLLSPAIRAASDLTGIEVYLESNRAMYNTRTASDGSFILTVPPGTHNVIALVPAQNSLTGKIYKARSNPVTVSDKQPTVEIAALSLKAAEAVLSGVIKNQSGNPVTAAKIKVWGEEHSVEPDGSYRIFMPDNTNAEVLIYANGYQESSFNIHFDNENPQYIEQTIVDTSVTNRPPVASLSAAYYQISVGSTLNLTGSAFDPDGDTLTVTFVTSSASGTVEQLSENSLNARFSANDNLIATITMIVKDPQGLQAKAAIRIKVGTGGVAQVNSVPVIADITANSTTLESGNSYQLRVSVTDADNDSLYYRWFINSEHGTLSPDNQQTTTWAIPPISATTTASITVMVTDKKSDPVLFNKQFQISPNPDLIGNQPPIIEIVSPQPDEFFVAGRPINFVASATDPNTPLSYKWEIDGVVVSNQQSFSQAFNATGTHSLRLIVADKFLASNSISQTFRINNKPTVSITSPAEGFICQASETVTFDGSASDTEDGNLPSNRLVWTFPDGSTKTGFTVDFKDFGYGTNTVELSAYDNMNEWAATQTRNIYVNSPPIITSIRPASGTEVRVGETVNFEACVTDPDSSFQTLTYTWYSGTNQLGTGNPFTTTLPAGIHDIMVVVDDGTIGVGSSTASYTRLIVNNSTPTISINEPASGTRFDTDATIHFSATASDDDPNDTLTIEWYDGNLDNNPNLQPFSTNEDFDYPGLTNGYHTIFAKVVDAGGYSSVASIGVFINTLPIATVTISCNTGQYATAPGDIPVFISNTPGMDLTLSITATDYEDGGIPGTRIGWFVWDGNEYDHIATSTNVSHPFPLGTNTIKVEVYDSYYDSGFPATQTRTVIFKSLHVWQKIEEPNSHSSLTASAAYIEGSDQVINPTLLITDDAGKQIKEVSWDGNRAIGQLSTDYTNYTPAVSNTPLNFSLVKCGIEFNGQKVLMGTQVSGGDLIYAFANATDTGAPLQNNPLSESTSSIAFNKKYPNQKLAYASFNASGKIIAFDSETGVTSTPILELTRANTIPLGNKLRIRFNTKLEDEGFGSLFIADQDNNRIVITYPTLTDPVSLPADKPMDVAFAQSYFFTINADTKEITLHDPTKSPTEQMKFGSAAEFIDPVGIFCSGYDLFILERTGELKVIRSGMSDWLKGNRL